MNIILLMMRTFYRNAWRGISLTDCSILTIDDMNKK